MKSMWDQRYSENEWVYGRNPNSFFKACIDELSPGKILLPAEGEGRNALYAAKKGWQVKAVDFSEAGRQKALRRASEENLHLNYELADLANWHSKEKFDCIGLIYSHLPPEYRERLHRDFSALLEPGGTILLECFNKNQLNFSSGGPQNIEWLYSKAMLEQDFEGLHFELLEEVITELDESAFHSGKAALIRMIARNPG